MRPARAVTWTAVGVLVGIGAIVAWLLAHRSVGTDQAATAAPNVRLVVARRGTFTERVTAQGRIGPPAGSSSRVAFAQPGILRTVLVHVGDTVTSGEPLAELDRTSLANAVAQAEADVRTASAGYSGGTIPQAALSSAQAKLDVAKARLETLQRGGEAALSNRIAAQAAARQANLKVSADRAALARAQALFAAGVIAAKDLAAARSQLASDLADKQAADAKVAAAGADYDAALKAARADVASAQNDVKAAQGQGGVLGGQVAAAEAKLEAARIAYANGVLAAHSDGVVLAILKHPGEAVDTTTPVLEIGPAIAHGVTLSVPAEAARRIRVGAPATLHVPQSRQPSAGGRVIAVVPAIDPTTQAATVVLSGVPHDAIAGDAVTASIVVARIDGILVPSSAIVQDPQSSKTVVFIRVAAAAQGQPGFTMRDVAVTASDASTALVSSGLRSGETVAAQGSYSLLAPSGG